jgi:DNA-3-methyladenine glycosylase I
MEKVRCKWCNLANPLYVKYHDEEWCVPTYDDAVLFEFVILEAFQAGLSWETILNKRENFREAFDQFDPYIIKEYEEDKIDELMNNKGIIRNRRKEKNISQKEIRSSLTFSRIWNSPSKSNHYGHLSWNMQISKTGLRKSKPYYQH